ncbi:MAG TPA: winged helix-turn-helix domain-containing protein, partial [Pyrinomonadaceae bacterium]
MSEQSGRVYEFGPFVLDPDRDILLKGGEPVALPPKAFALLVALVRAGGRTVTKDEILREIWPDTAVEEQNVGQNIHLVRKALSDEADRPSYVVT